MVRCLCHAKWQHFYSSICIIQHCIRKNKLYINSLLSLGDINLLQFLPIMLGRSLCSKKKKEKKSEARHCSSVHWEKGLPGAVVGCAWSKVEYCKLPTSHHMCAMVKWNLICIESQCMCPTLYSTIANYIADKIIPIKEKCKHFYIAARHCCKCCS